MIWNNIKTFESAFIGALASIIFVRCIVSNVNALSEV
jgi:hypothetical protein